MKVGDYVKKVSGMDYGKCGVVVEIVNPDAAHKLVTVLVDGQVKAWAAHLVMVING